MSTWHVTHPHLDSYKGGTAPAVLVDSIEAHLLHCEECRAALAGTGQADGGASRLDESDRRWAAISARIDAGASRPTLRLGIATRPLATALAVAALLLVVLPAVVAALAGTERVPTMVLAGAPLAPMLAVVFAYRRETDPAGELSLAAPVSGIRLVARRALLVALAGIPLGVGTALATGLSLEVALAWLLPGLALSGAVLLASTTRVDPAAVAAVLGGGWAVTIGVFDRLRSADVVVDLVTGAPTQVGSLVTAAVVLAVAFARRDRLSYRSAL